MDFPPRDLPELAPAYLPPLELPHTGYYNALLTQQLDGSYGVNRTSAFTLQAQLYDGPGVTTQNHTLHPLNLPTLHPDHARFDFEFAGDSQFASASTSAPASPMGAPIRLRKRKAATLRADDWEPYKMHILDLHIKQKKTLPEVMRIVEEKYGFKAEYVAVVRARQSKQVLSPVLTQTCMQATAVPIAHQPMGKGQERQAAGDASDRAKTSKEEARRYQQGPARVRGARQPRRAFED
jgi:hypothetical protein